MITHDNYHRLDLQDLNGFYQAYGYIYGSSRCLDHDRIIDEITQNYRIMLHRLNKIAEPQLLHGSTYEIVMKVFGSSHVSHVTPPDDNDHDHPFIMDEDPPVAPIENHKKSSMNIFTQPSFHHIYSHMTMNLPFLLEHAYQVVSNLNVVDLHTLNRICNLSPDWAICAPLWSICGADCKTPTNP